MYYLIDGSVFVIFMYCLIEKKLTRTFSSVRVLYFLRLFFADQLLTHVEIMLMRWVFIDHTHMRTHTIFLNLNSFAHAQVKSQLQQQQQ